MTREERVRTFGRLGEIVGAIESYRGTLATDEVGAAASMMLMNAAVELQRMALGQLLALEGLECRVEGPA